MVAIIFTVLAATSYTGRESLSRERLQATHRVRVVEVVHDRVENTLTVCELHPKFTGRVVETGVHLLLATNLDVICADSELAQAPHYQLLSNRLRSALIFKQRKVVAR